MTHISDDNLIPTIIDCMEELISHAQDRSEDRSVIRAQQVIAALQNDKTKEMKLLNRYQHDAPGNKYEAIVFRIVHDINDRRGLRQAWEDCDEETQQEILESWIECVEEMC